MPKRFKLPLELTVEDDRWHDERMIQSRIDAVEQRDDNSNCHAVVNEMRAPRGSSYGINLQLIGGAKS